MSAPNQPDEQDYLCVGVCLPDEEERYCIGCGRPWGQRSADDWDDLNLPPIPEEGADDDAPTQPDPA
jgi:hypothetical protein